MQLVYSLLAAFGLIPEWVLEILYRIAAQAFRCLALSATCVPKLRSESIIRPSVLLRVLCLLLKFTSVVFVLSHSKFSLFYSCFIIQSTWSTTLSCSLLETSLALIRVLLSSAQLKYKLWNDGAVDVVGPALAARGLDLLGFV